MGLNLFLFLGLRTVISKPDIAWLLIMRLVVYINYKYFKSRVSGTIRLFEKKWPGDTSGHRDGCTTLLFTNKMFFPGSPSYVVGKEIQFGVSGTRSEIEIFRLNPFPA